MASLDDGFDSLFITRRLSAALPFSKSSDLADPILNGRLTAGLRDLLSTCVVADISEE
jgi:hypothetical protein